MTDTRDPGISDGPIRVCLIEDNTYLRVGWTEVFTKTRGFDVVGAYGSLEAAEACSKQVGKAQVMLLDIGLPGRDGIAGARDFSKQFPDLAIIIVTVHDDNEHVFEALRAGAVGYLLKGVEPDQLVQAVRSARQGGAPMTPNVARKVIDAFRLQSPPRDAKSTTSLTDKEREVLQHLVRGESYATVSELMSLSLDGVRYHIRHIYEKLHVHSRSEAVAKGLKQSLIKPPW